MENKYRIIDTHAHYDDEAYDEDREEVLKQIKEKETLNFKISVDGGINEEILPKLNNTDIIVSASYVLDNLDNIEKIHNL